MSLFLGYSTLLRQIDFVADQYSVHVLLGVLLDGLHPSLNVLEGLFVSNVVNYNNSVSFFIKTRGDVLESLLTGRVPYFDVDLVTIFLGLVLNLGEIKS